MARVAMIGLGVVGASIGLALQETLAAGKGRRESVSVVGYDRQFRRAEEALVCGAVGQVSRSLDEALEQADLVILAQSAAQVVQTLREIAPLLPPRCIVTDTAESKVEVIRTAEGVLPPGVSFVGGHPILLPQQTVDWSGGAKGARADLFAGSVYCLIPARKASEEAVETVRSLARAIGAAPFYLDAYEHDGLWAGLSQAPYVAAVALLATVGQSEGWRDLKLLADPTFRRLGELLHSLPPESPEGCLSNRQTLVSWLDRVIAALVEVRREMAAPDEPGTALQRMAEKARTALEDWEQRRDERTKELQMSGMADVQRSRDQFLGLFVPQALLRKREQEDDAKRR